MAWDEAADGQAQWLQLESTQICNEMLKRGGRKQPDWLVALVGSL